jgi:hypothetical protein
MMNTLLVSLYPSSPFPIATAKHGRESLSSFLYLVLIYLVLKHLERNTEWVMTPSLAPSKQAHYVIASPNKGRLTIVSVI